jgi:hypothetical protein
VKTVGLTEGVIGKSRAEAATLDRDLLSALSGTQAGRDGAVANRTRRVVMASLGVMQEQKAGRKRTRSVAIASVLVILLLVGPAAWRVADDLIGGERFGDIATQTSLLFGILCVALVGAVVVAGWARRRDS